MYEHHETSILNVVNHFKQNPAVETLLLAGSLAHGFGEAASDVDILIVLSEPAYRERLTYGQMQFFSQELCTYPEGYVDGKYISRAYLNQVAEKGSDPARFAFEGAQVLFSKDPTIQNTLAAIVRYPLEEKAARMKRFYAQFEAWYWYSGEAFKRNNPYLLGMALNKVVLFGGRLILTHNEQLYPYHKWFLKVLEQAPEKPESLMAQITTLYQIPSRENLQKFYETVKGFRDWGLLEAGWSGQFMIDSELNWLTGTTPVDDL